METEKYVPVNDEARLKQTGIPYTKATLYRFKCQSKYPGLVIKIGGRVVVDVAEFEKLILEGKKDAAKRAAKMEEIRNAL